MTTDILETSRARRLKARTSSTHDRLDTAIMAAASFASVEGYGRFAGVQALFHRDVDALYDDARLQALLPGLTARRRLPLILADLVDIGVPVPRTDTPPAFSSAGIDIPTALGWLYVAEGSNMGAALLRKEVAKLGLSDSFGGRHLAPAADGPAAQWRNFTAALDAIDLDAESEERAVTGAQAAFARVQFLVDAHIS
ncbi:MAG: biliverdin-producing heme oxygenase [Novosphingobium sp.]